MLNKEVLKSIATKNDTAKNIFYVLGTRQRTRHTVNLNRFRLALTKQFGNIVKEDFDNTFQELADAKIGKISKGIFLWNYDLIKVARFVMNGGETPDAIGERRTRRVPRPVIEERRPVVETPEMESPIFPGMRVDIKKGDTTITATLNAEQLLEVLKKIG